MHDKGVAGIIHHMTPNPMRKILSDCVKIESDEDPGFSKTIKRHHKKTIPYFGES